MRTFDVNLPGTSAEIWSSWLGQRRWPPLDLAVAPTGRLVVIAPHPDDETLGAGGLVSSVLRQGGTVVVLALTDGEAADPHALDEHRSSLGARRRQEQRAATAALGVDGERVVRLGFGDGRLVDQEAELEDALEPYLDREATLAVTWEGDGHPDHEAAGRAAARAAAWTGARLIRYPIWAWQWDCPDAAGMPWADARLHGLDEVSQARKAAAVDAYRSQTEPQDGRPPILPAHVLRRLIGPREMFFEGAPHDG